MGPQARALMAQASPDDFSTTVFPFGTSREIDLGYARIRASRLTYVGELGYELYIESEFAAYVHDTLIKAGQALGLKPAGFFALNSLRMEKGYRHWGHDIGEEDTPWEGGLGFAVALDTPRQAESRCTTGTERRIIRWKHGHLIDAMREMLSRDTDSMTLRSCAVEHPFGTIKAWMGHAHFLTCRLKNVRTEMALNVLAITSSG